MGFQAASNHRAPATRQNYAIIAPSRFSGCLINHTQGSLKPLQTAVPPMARRHRSNP
ncbi:hypothetical protein [Kingella oralis]|uniref:hypothetical protein n=1 Tax=Kingella oralis TaxID=505 RepID=UPI0034E4D14C